MAAKVAMVAVPTVLGIASIRVYTIRDAPSDGLVNRQKLNIYTPLVESSPVDCVPESPGVIESGVTATREGVLPIFQAVKGACVSLKNGTVNLYHAGEDVYYYLKDPPPGFLPRVGTISMAGLLGMFLARKGSRFKRLALPLGLTCAGASVCYPAQAVAVCKMTGKKVYAVGQWSITSMSSLFTSTQPVAKEIVASQPQSVTVPNVSHEASAQSSVADFSPQSSTIQEYDVESAMFVPVPSSSVVVNGKEEESMVTLTETFDPSTETNAENEMSEIPVTVEDSDIKQTVDANASSLPESIESTVKAAVEAVVPLEAPIESPAPVEAALVEEVATLVGEAAPAEEAVPVREAAPVQAAPVQEVAPVETAPVQEVAPVETAPVQEVAPVETAPVQEAALAEAACVDPNCDATVEPATVEDASVEATPVDTKSEASPVESGSVVEGQIDQSEAVEASRVNTGSEAPQVSEEPRIPQAFIDLEASLAEPGAAAHSEGSDKTQDSAAHERESVTPSPAAEDSKEGSGFKSDPSIMDFGQASPEDADLYSTRS